MIALNWNDILQQLANTILPDLVKIVFYTVVIPVIGMIAATIHKKMVSSHFGFIIKWAAQKIPTTVENWQDKRLQSAVDLAKQHWYLRWMSEDTMKQYVEVAVRTYRDSLLAEGINTVPGDGTDTKNIAPAAKS